MNPWSEVMEIVAPGYRHLAEEKDRRRLSMQIPGRGDDPLGVDLDKGVVRLHVRPGRPDPAGESAGEPGAQDAGGDVDGDRA